MKKEKMYICEREEKRKDKSWIQMRKQNVMVGKKQNIVKDYFLEKYKLIKTLNLNQKIK